MRHKIFQKFSSGVLVVAGLVLLFGPRQWFPGFYSPVFMGMVALISPFLIYLPRLILKKSSPQKERLTLKISSIIAFSLLVNMAGELGLYQLYKYGFEYDKFAHFGVSMLFAFILGESLKEWEHLSSRKIVWLVLIIVFSSGILWEVFEATSDFLFKTQEWGVYGRHLAGDTYRDVAFNALGALAGVIVFMIPSAKPRTNQKQ